MAIISNYAEEVEKALETVGGEASAAARGWSLGPPRAAVTLCHAARVGQGGSRVVRGRLG